MQQPMSRRKKTQRIESIARCLEILNAFSIDQPEIGVSATSRKLGVHRSTVSRLLKSLEAGGIVQQSPETGKYRLGLKILELAGIFLSSLDVRAVVRPFAQALAEKTGETVNLAILDGFEAVNIEQIPSPHPIKYIGWIGRRTPAHCTATGKALLAFQPKALQEKVIRRGLPARTPRTITAPQAFWRELERIRRRGYAVAEEEFEEGLSAIAAPIRDHSGRVVAVISISGPSYRLTSQVIRGLVPLLLEEAHAISAQLGYRGEGSPAETPE